HAPAHDLDAHANPERAWRPPGGGAGRAAQVLVRGALWCCPCFRFRRMRYGRGLRRRRNQILIPRPSIPMPDQAAHLLPPGPVMVDVAGAVLTAAEKRRLRDPRVGGVILFARNF